MDLAVRVVIGTEILGLKRDEKRLGLCGINLLHRRTEPLRPIIDFLGRLGDFAIDETEHGTHETTRIGLNRQAAVERRPRNAGVRMNDEGMLGGTKHRGQHIGLLGVRHENAVEIHRRAFVDTSFLDPRKRLLLEEVENDERGRMLGDTGENGEILDDTNRMTLRSLDGADEAPGGTVKLARCEKLTGLLHRSLNATKMADRRVLG